MTKRSAQSVFQPAFQLLLILTLVLQPVMTAYAMTGMPFAMLQGDAHGLGVSQPVAKSCHAMKQMAVESQHAGHQGIDQTADNSDMGDCCHSGACCSIAVFAVSNLTLMPTPALSAQLPVSWGDVVLSSEYKPPRTLLV